MDLLLIYCLIALAICLSILIIPSLLRRKRITKNVNFTEQYFEQYACSEIGKRIPGCEITFSATPIPFSDSSAEYINTNKIWYGKQTIACNGFKMTASYQKVPFEMYWIQKSVLQKPLYKEVKPRDQETTFIGTYLLFDLTQQGPLIFNDKSDFMLCDSKWDQKPEHTHVLTRTAVDEAKMDRESEKNSHFSKTCCIQDHDGHSYRMYLNPWMTEEHNDLISKLMHISELLHRKHNNTAMGVFCDNKKLVISINMLCLLYPLYLETEKNPAQSEKQKKQTSEDIDLLLEILNGITVDA